MLVFGLNSQAQFKVNGVGVAFDVNGSGTMKSSALIKKLGSSNADLFSSEDPMYMSRIFTSYSLTLNNPVRDYFALELDLLQGFENIYGSNYNWSERGDSSFSTSVSYDLRSSTLGLRAIAKFRTPSKKRFHYHFGIGAEAIANYNVNTDASSSVSIYHWPSNYSYYESNEISTKAIKNYQSYNLIQQVGIAFRLGRDEKSFPLNNTYFETDFQIFTNFTALENEISTYRGYGGSFSLIYEFR